MSPWSGGSWTERMRSVQTMAKTPSLNASIREVGISSRRGRIAIPSLALRAALILDLHHFVAVLPVLLNGLVVRFAVLHVGLVTDLHFLGALGQVLDDRAGGRRHHGVAARPFLVVGAAIVVVVRGLV